MSVGRDRRGANRLHPETEAAVALVLIPGSNAREGHFGETNPSCRNATAAKAARL